MQFHFKAQTYLKSGTHFIVAMILLFMSSLGFAKTVTVNSNIIIKKPTTYQNITLDLAQGEFTISAGGVLTIENSIINVTISPANPFFVHLINGQLILKNSTVNTTVSGITPNSGSPSIYQLITVDQGLVTLDTNVFNIDTAFTVGFLRTNPEFTTEGFSINNNTINTFHGGVYLMNSSNAEVNNNTFNNVSFSNVFNIGNQSNFKGNIFSFPGNLAYGDAFDLVNSSALTVSNNIIASSSNYGIYLMGSQNVLIDNNKITDGLSYAIYIQAPSMGAMNKNKFLSHLTSKYKAKLALLENSNITVTNNYIALNRYGLAGNTLVNLNVQNNTFIQRFADNATRQFWTNNDNLLIGATKTTWLNNLYKEGFTQDIEGDNSLSLQFIEFPARGGVSL